MNGRLRRAAVLLGVTAAFLLVAAALSRAAADAVRTSQEAGAETFDELIGVGALVGAALAACWLAVGFTAAAAATIAGRAAGPGAALDRLARRVAPRPLHRLARLVAGAGVLAWGVVPAGSALAQTTPGLPDLDRPAVATAAASTTALSPPGTTGPGRPPDDSQPVVVARGDTLWDIAAARLGSAATNAEIARAWPQWYVQNEQIIGSDPDLIIPGQRLRPPA